MNIRLSIRHRLLLLTLLPLLFISLVLGGYFTYTRFHDVENNLIQRGELLARLLASSSEFALMTKNQELLQSVSKGPLLEQDVVDILFLDGNYQLLHRSADFAIHLITAAPQAYRHQQYWYFTQPIVTSGIPFLDNPEFQETERITDTVGWVTVVISNSRTGQQQQQILWTSVIILFVFLLTVFIAQRFGNRISRPIADMAAVMQTIQEGNLSARVQKRYFGEFNLLASGLNALADNVQQLITEQQIRINRATRKLESAMYHLQKQNSELIDARQQAEEANLAKDEFLARMSHELRTPLTSVVGFARLLNHSPCTPEQQEYTRIINQTAQMLLSIIDDILDFSKLEQNAILLERIQFNLEQVIYDVLEMQAPSAYEKGLELICHIADFTSAEVTGDPTRLRQILVNLISNGIKFTDSGSVELHIESTTISSQQSLFTIKIIDTGIGIPCQHLENLFQAFTQADTSITRRFGGSGLGLVISKRLTELMGGRLEMFSQEGEGTTVTLHLPMRTSLNPLTHSGELAYLDTPLLFFEPNASLRRSLSDLLRHRVHQIHTVRSLEECLQLADDYQIIMLGIPALCTQRNTVLAALERLVAKQPELILLTPSGVTLPDLKHVKPIIINKPVRTDQLYRALHIDKSQQQPAAPHHNQQLAGLHVLVAEDNELNRLLITKILSHQQIQVSVVETGLDALLFLEHNQPDCIIMDVHMPVMDGLEATGKIKSLYPNLPIIALTANIIEHEHMALYHAGVSDVLLKPINDTKLLNTLATLTHGKLSVAMDVTDHNILARYGVAQSHLHEEMFTLTTRMEQLLLAADAKKLADVNHQLSGISGLYQLAEIENCCALISQQLDQTHYSARILWRLVQRLKRLVAHHNEPSGHQNQRDTGVD